MLSSHDLADRCASIFLKSFIFAFPALIGLGIASSAALGLVSNGSIEQIILFFLRALAVLIIGIPLCAGGCGFVLFLYHACKLDFRGNIRVQLASLFLLTLAACVCVWIGLGILLVDNRAAFIHSSRAILESLNAAPASQTSASISALVQTYDTPNEVNVTHIKVENNRSLYTYSNKIGLGSPKLHIFRNEKEQSAPWKCEVINHGNVAKGFFYLWCIPPDDPEKEGAGKW